MNKCITSSEIFTEPKLFRSERGLIQTFGCGRCVYRFGLSFWVTKDCRITAVFKPMERFPKIAWVGGVSGTPIGRNAESYLSLTFFFRNVLEIKK